MGVAHLYLAAAILVEVIGTSCMKLTEGFTKPLPTLVMSVCYIGAIYFMSVSVRTLPIGFVYAVWAGVGIVVIAAVGVVLYKEPVDLPGALGIALIVAGVVLLNLFSRMGGHA